MSNWYKRYKQANQLKKASFEEEFNSKLNYPINVDGVDYLVSYSDLSIENEKYQGYAAPGRDPYNTPGEPGVYVNMYRVVREIEDEDGKILQAEIKDASELKRVEDALEKDLEEKMKNGFDDFDEPSEPLYDPSRADYEYNPPHLR